MGILERSEDFPKQFLLKMLLQEALNGSLLLPLRQTLTNWSERFDLYVLSYAQSLQKQGVFFCCCLFGLVFWDYVALYIV